MVKLTKIYTRGGDGGETSLGDGARTAKDDLRIEAYGTVDEANAVIGLARAVDGLPDGFDSILSHIQNNLFDLGADLCVPENGKKGGTALRITADQTAWLEGEIDRINAPLPTLESFVLPAGTPAAAHLHHARTVARCAERRVISLTNREEINAEVVRYLNRLSDLLYVMTRAANAEGSGDVLWVPGRERGDS